MAGKEDGWTTLAQVNGRIKYYEWPVLNLEIMGSVATLRVNGFTQVRYDFGVPVSGGLVGLGSQNGQAIFEQVKVEPCARAEFEFVELVGTTAEPVDLAGWKLAGTAEYLFPPNATVAADAPLVVVSFDPANTTMADSFRKLFGVPEAVPLIGPFFKNLGHDGSRVQLMKPGDGAVAPTGFVLVDQVVYYDVAPWPAAANGMGASLQRRTTSAFGDFAVSWRAQSPTPGLTTFVQLGDLDWDGAVDADDVDDFVLGLSNPAAYERRHTVAATVAGDIDLDGDLDLDDIDDFVALLAAGGAGAATAGPLEFTSVSARGLSSTAARGALRGGGAGD